MRWSVIRTGLVAAVVPLLLSFAPAASAQVFRAYLALDGSDANPCTLQLPCRLLPAALTAVAVGGEIWMLDSANYNSGPINVTKSVTILAVPGALGSVVALGGSAFTLDTAGVKVTLRNLNILPFPGNTTFHGIEVNNAASLTVEDCRVFGFTSGVGLWVIAATQVTILDTAFRDNSSGVILSQGARARVSNSHFTGNASSGLYVAGTIGATTTSAAVTDSVAANNATGFAAETQAPGATARLSVTRSVVESNTQYGVTGYSVIGGQATIMVSDSTFVANATAVRSAGTGGGTVTIRNNTITHNDTGLSQFPGVVLESSGGNTLQANTNNTGGSTVITPVPTL